MAFRSVFDDMEKPDFERAAAETPELSEAVAMDVRDGASTATPTEVLLISRRTPETS